MANQHSFNSFKEFYIHAIENGRTAMTTVRPSDGIATTIEQETKERLVKLFDNDSARLQETLQITIDEPMDNAAIHAKTILDDAYGYRAQQFGGRVPRGTS